MKEFKFLWTALIIIALCIIGVGAVHADEANATPQSVSGGVSLSGVVSGGLSVSEAFASQSDGGIKGFTVNTFNAFGRAPLVIIDHQTAYDVEGVKSTVGSQTLLGVSGGLGGIVASETVGGMICSAADQPFCDKALSSSNIALSDGAYSSVAGVQAGANISPLLVSHSVLVGTPVNGYTIPSVATGSAKFTASSSTLDGVNEQTTVDNQTITKAVPLYTSEYNLNTHMQGTMAIKYDYGYQSQRQIIQALADTGKLPFCCG